MDKKPTGFKEGIELKEFETLKMLNFIFHSSLDTYLSNFLKYIPYITLPIIMASLEGKPYNPFANIIEKYISYIVNKKMIDAGYNMLPLGYSSDLCFEKDDLIINIDIKTANINNPSDFSKEIALGFNQTTYPASLPTGKCKSSDYVREGIDVVKVYSKTLQVKFGVCLIKINKSIKIKIVIIYVGKARTKSLPAGGVYTSGFKNQITPRWWCLSEATPPADLKITSLPAGGV